MGEVEKIDTSECLGCNRRFTVDRIDKHQNVCKKYKELEELNSKKVIAEQKKMVPAS